MTMEMIKDELMSEEQLDQVAGGTRGELSCDTKLLHALGLMDHYYEPGYVENHMNEVAAEVSAATKKAGISYGLEIKHSVSDANEYQIKRAFGIAKTPTTRAELYKMICNGVGKPDFDFTKYL